MRKLAVPIAMMIVGFAVMLLNPYDRDSWWTRSAIGVIGGTMFGLGFGQFMQRRRADER